MKPGYLLTLTWYPQSGVGGVNQAIFSTWRASCWRKELISRIC